MGRFLTVTLLINQYRTSHVICFLSSECLVADTSFPKRQFSPGSPDFVTGDRHHSLSSLPRAPAATSPRGVPATACPSSLFQVETVLPGRGGVCGDGPGVRVACSLAEDPRGEPAVPGRLLATVHNTLRALCLVSQLLTAGG